MSVSREEAIKWTRAIKDKYIHGGDEAFDERRKEALDMAIKALEEPEKSCGMNEILRSLIKWTEENKVIPEIYFTSISGGIWLNLKLSKRDKHVRHSFYVPGGVLCLSNWDMFPNQVEEEVNCFIEEAKNALLEKGENK